MSQLNWFVLITVLHATCMIVDEFYFHMNRVIPKWERRGHPLDTLTVLAIFFSLSQLNYLLDAPLWFFVLLIFSSLFVTKDEWVHKEHCSGGELWLHAVLFVLHPVLLFLAYSSWKEVGFSTFHQLQLFILIMFFFYQVIYWNFMKSESSKVNNDFYNHLGEDWYQSENDSVALLRAEAKIKNPWVKQKIQNKFFDKNMSDLKLLDVGCGAGLLTNDLVQDKIQVTGIDLSKSSLAIAQKYDLTKKVEYINANAYELPFKNESFDVVTSMDFLEHVEDPGRVVLEISRVLKPGGLFIFHTFNRNQIAHLIIIKGMEWLVNDVPENLHVIELFVKPSEMKKYCLNAKMSTPNFTGIAPKLLSATFFKLLFLRKVDPNFKFKLQKSTLVAYLGTSSKTF